jgi:hypothetical protein
MKFGAKGLEDIRRHQPGLETIEDRGLQDIITNVEAITAGAPVARRGAAEKVGADLDVAGRRHGEIYSLRQKPVWR